MTSFFDQLADLWFAWIVPASWQLALLVVAVAGVAWVARRASPRLRYALWLLVLVKVFLPTSLGSGWGIGSWGLDPLWDKIQPVSTQVEVVDPMQADGEIATDKMDVEPHFRTEQRIQSSEDRTNLISTMFALWTAGCAVIAGAALWQYRRLKRAVMRMELVDSGPLAIRLAKIVRQMGIARPPKLYLSDRAASPFLMGLAEPCIVLPRQIVDELSPAAINSVLLHELSHWHRRDPWIGWLQVVAQSLFWFHPFLWWANARLRHERECVCDEAVLRTGRCEPVGYGEALLAVLSSARGRSPAQGGLVGVFESGSNIQNRLEEIMNYEPKKRKFGFLCYLTIAMFALIFLPMAGSSRAINTTAPPKADPADRAAQIRRFPWIVSTTPAIGATEVDPALEEIIVTFDRDMAMSADRKRGMSWTGDKNFYLPPGREGAQPLWRDKRTCVLPVKLEKGKYYRVGINSTSYQNFKSAKGEAAPCSVIYFTTRGASKATLARLRVPQVVKMLPENNATDVDPKTNAMRVTFNLPMAGGMSWTGGGERFPTIPKDRKSKWTSGGKTCVLPVELRPGHEYRLGLNSVSHINFQSKWGVPAEPIVYQFTTSGPSE